MSVCLFVEGGEDCALRDAERALIHTASQAHDPYLDDGAAPRSIAQLYFSNPERIPERPKGVASYELMEVHRFDVPDARIAAEPWCTYLVRYEGPAKDEKDWLAYYLASHPPLMSRLPGIRELEIYTPTGWDGWGTGRVRSLQRNKVAFDSAAGLCAALNSPVRHEMRADFATFPEYSGRVLHFAMLTRRIPGTPGPS